VRAAPSTLSLTVKTVYCADIANIFILSMFAANSVIAIGLILAAVALASPANALSGPMPGSKLQNFVPTDVEQVRGFVARGRAAASLPVGPAIAADTVVESDIVAALRTVVHIGPASTPRRGHVPAGTGGLREARLRPVRPLASSPPARLRHERARRQSLATAGSTPMPAEPMASGTLAHTHTRPMACR
jgi:hypothetical protein